ncbi:unnamed protein product [Prunus brigantina]
MGFYNKISWVLAFLGFMFLGGLSNANGAIHHYDFVLKETNFTRLCDTKSILTVNGSLPGPTITVRKGDTAFVNVYNQGLYGLTIHWHGVKQPRNPWSDGPENVTQCPIAAGTNFTYEVIFSSEEGTLWWHAHSDWTRATVYGAIVILPALNTTYPFVTPDAQETLLLGSWFKGDVMEIIEEALASGGDPNISDAFVINGQPGDLYDCSNETTYRWLVDYGKTYLLRVINAVMNEEQFFAIANHTLTVVAQDAAYIKPITTSYIMITPGQTMDILVTANQPPSHYYIASKAFVDGAVNFNNSTTTAIVQYNGNYSAPFTTPFPTLPDYDNQTAADNFTSQKRALASKEHPISVPLEIHSKIIISIAINERICPNSSCSGPDGNALSASLNNISFELPSTYNLVDPPEVNTIGVPKNGWAAIRFSFPGPIIRAQKGDTVYVNVYNEGRYGVTLHWHGIKQPRNPWFDGPEYVTQCPIQPGTNFTYQILLSSEEGTLFWHAHSDWSRATVHGAFVILPANGTSYPFPKPDGEQVILFASWYKEDVMTLLDETLKSGGLTTSSDSYTINGEPGDFYLCSKETTYRMSVDYGKTYLLRIVNSVQNVDMFFAIADHNLTVVGADGAYVKPIVTTYIMITPGQTMDVLVTAKQSLGHYYMFASPYYDGEADDFDKSMASAVFQYNGNYTPPSSPIYPTYIPGYYDIDSARKFVTQFRSLASAEHPVDVPQNVSTRMFITISIGMLHCPNNSCAGPEGNRIASGLNNISFANPAVDVLQAYYRNISGYYDASFPDEPPNLFNFTAEDLTTDNYTITSRATRVKMLDYNATVEITLQGTNIMDSGENHPVHLHGFRFYVIGSGLGNFNNVTDPLTYNLVDPPEVNTFPVPKDGWATIRFIANNPGVWFMHCHFDRHMSWGMDTVFIVKNGGTDETSIRPPPDYLPACSKNSLFGADQSMLQMGE